MFDALFAPVRIAVMADSMAEGSVGRRLVERLVVGGFAGDVVPVCEEEGEVAGQACVAGAEDASGPVDLAVIAMEAAQVRRAVGKAARAGARAVVVASAGFRGAGPAGAELERGWCRSASSGMWGFSDRGPWASSTCTTV